MTPAEQRHANLELRAYLALQGAAGPGGDVGDWRNDLVAVLRSPASLSPEFREALAKAFDGDLYGFRLELAADKGVKKRRQDAHRGVLIRRRQLEIGEWIEVRIEADKASKSPTKDAIEAATKLPGTGDYKSCENALTYARRVRRWRASQEPDRVALLGAALDGLFHLQDARGSPLDK